MKKVLLNVDNFGQCLCPDCPVQAKSECVAELRDNLDVALEDEPLDPEQLPGMYCATGVAECEDLETGKTCLCYNCSVFDDNDMEDGLPYGYYCRDGKAKQLLKLTFQPC